MILGLWLLPYKKTSQFFMHNAREKENDSSTFKRDEMGGTGLQLN
jgi:hypothetical protein